MEDNESRQLRAALMQRIAEMITRGDRAEAEKMRPLANADFAGFSPEELSGYVPDFRNLIDNQAQAENALNSGMSVVDLVRLLGMK